jgi:hypothetical protein
LQVGRLDPPQPAHPQETFIILFPRPVTRDPSDVVSDRFLVWRNLLNACRWLLIDHRPRLRIKHHRLRKRLMNRTASELLAVKLWSLIVEHVIVGRR